MTTNVKPQILRRSSAEQRFECAFSMESSEPYSMFPCQKFMTWPMEHAFLLLTCTSQSLSWSQLTVFSDPPAQYPCTRRYQKPLRNSKNLVQVLQKSSSGSWKKIALVHAAFTDMAFGDCFLNKTLLIWMCRIWAHSFHWLSWKFHAENPCIAENTGIPNDSVQTAPAWLTSTESLSLAEMISLNQQKHNSVSKVESSIS